MRSTRLRFALLCAVVFVVSSACANIVESQVVTSTTTSAGGGGATTASSTGGTGGTGGTCGTPVPCKVIGLLGACVYGEQPCGSNDESCKQITFPVAETCNGVDDDCNGIVDDGNFNLGAPCNVPGLQGVCIIGEKVCDSNGQYCKQIAFSTAETCNGSDDDCDGAIDNGEPGGGDPCVITDPAIKGECVNGVSKCLSGQVTCTQNHAPEAESCNGKDDDCNGKVDDGPFCCPDLLKNGNETDVDCGGACAPCAPGLSCVQDGDCQSFVCETNKCQPAACNDAVKNGFETDVDCGGPICPARCSVGQNCNVVSDCTSNVCVSNVCLSPQCNDAVKNGFESDIDCGGSNCGACNIGKKCKVGSDCTSKVCSGGLCQAPTCSDAVKNGFEPGIDCGGPCPLKCGLGSSCTSDYDCTSGFCDNNHICAPKPTKPDSSPCLAASECSSGNCVDNVCCDSACGGVCMACIAILKSSGPDGVCGPIVLGYDPDNECANQGVASCGTTGFCDGAGACHKYPAGTLCAPKSCAGDGVTLITASTCNGLGTCVAGAMASCAPLACVAGDCTP